MFQCWALQRGACLADKVESSRVLDYVALCLSSIVVYEHPWVVGCMVVGVMGQYSV